MATFYRRRPIDSSWLLLDPHYSPYIRSPSITPSPSLSIPSNCSGLFFSWRGYRQIDGRTLAIAHFFFLNPLKRTSRQNINQFDFVCKSSLLLKHFIRANKKIREKSLFKSINIFAKKTCDFQMWTNDLFSLTFFMPIT